MNMETLKLNRNKAKLATIVCAKRLISRAQRNHDKEILHNLMIELEKAYSDFIDIDNEYADALEGEDLDLDEEAEVDGEDQEEFRNNVSKVYEDAKSKYTEIKTAEQLAENMKNAEPVHDNLRRNMNKIHNLLERLGSNLLSPKPDIYTLQYDSEAAGQLLDSMNNQLGTLLKLLGSEHMQKEQKALDEVTDSVERMNREVHIFMSKTKSESLQERYTRKLKDIEETRHTNPSTQQVEVKVETENNSNPPAPSNQVSQTQGNQTVNDTSFLNMSPQSPLASLPQSPNTSFHRADVKLKKLSFPSFSGNRRDWPEFRAVWKELAEHGCNSKTALAHELKHSVHGEAAQRIKSVFATKPEAYDIMWKKLESYYDDTSSSVQAAIGNLQKLKLVKEDDYKSLIELIDEVEATYSQLEELGQLDTITMRDVDRISGLLTTPTKVEWMRRYHDLPQVDKIKPFVPFMKFLEKERDIVSRMAETQPKVRSQWGDQYKGGQRDRNRSSVTNHGEGRESHQSPNGVPHRNFHRCAIPAHRRDGVAHTTESCYEFKKQSLPNKLKYLKETYACFICFGDHQRSRCPNRKPCSICQRSNHHSLLCKEADQSTGTSSANPARGTVQSHILATSTLSLYPIMVAEVSGVKKKATVFCDGGSNTTYITHRAAERLCAKRLRKFTLEVTTMGNVHKTYNTCQYELCLLTQCGKKVTVIAFGMEKITGSVSKLDTQVLSELFPDYNANLLQRCSDTVDILIGCDYFGLHPKIEVARAGENLSIMKGELGICLQGTHPKLKEETVIDISLAKTIHESFLLTSETVHSSDLYSHPEFTSPSSSQHQCLESTTLKASGKSKNVTLNDVPSTKSDEVTSIYLTAAKEKDTHNFIMGEELCIGSTPRCGACRCGKCPAVGHTYSFKEEQELRMIQDNLRYDRERSCWVTSYPWIVNPLQLPDSYHVAYQTLMNTERRLKKDPEWASTYSRQIEDMVERGVARKLSKVELEDWNGPKFYINHLAVQNLKSQSTPVRIVFNSSQVIQGISLNSCLAKGPDCYLNNLVGLLLRWREEEVAVVGDIKKMFNSIHLESLEQHCHRFLWRNLETERQPDVYIIERVNMGDTPAPAISTEAIYKTAEMFKEESPRAAELLTKSSYVDDLIDSFKDVTEAQQITSQAEAMLSKGGFKVKCWQFSGKDENHNKASKGLLKGTKDNLRVLGLGWRPEEDVMIFQVTLNFSQKRKGQRTGPNLEEMEAPAGIPTNLTRRMVLEQVMAIYDPLGFLSPFTLQAKVYLRETWELKLGWDDTVPYSLQRKWMKFFQSMFEMEDIKYERCLRPSKAVGKPSLVILSDGSNIAYGCAAYILWTLEDGNHWLRLIMAKSRIAPINRLSTPQSQGWK